MDTKSDDTQSTAADRELKELDSELTRLGIYDTWIDVVPPMREWLNGAPTSPPRKLTLVERVRLLGQFWNACKERA